MSFDQFIEKWVSDFHPPEPVLVDELEQAERRSGIRLPESYKAAVMRAGTPSTTIALLDAIVEREIALPDVHDFLTPEEMIEASEGWRPMGFPEWLIAFATDCSGNLFGFNRGGEVWLFDHDLDTVTVQAPNFDAWITAYCEIEPVPGEID